MYQKMYSEAFKEALKDPKVITTLATATAKKLVELKTKSSSVEDGLVKKHVIFVGEDNEDGKWMTNKQIMDAILEINGDIELRSRIFGKALISDCLATRDARVGRQYFVLDVVEKIDTETLKELEEAQLAKAEADAKKALETTEEAKETPVTSEEVVAEENKAKKEKTSKKPTHKGDEFTTEDLEGVQACLEDFDSVKDYKEYLKGLSEKALIKQCNKYKLKVHTEGFSDKEIAKNIINYIKDVIAYAEKEAESEEVEQPKTGVKKEKKKEKSSKKELKKEEAEPAKEEAEKTKKEKKKDKKKDKKDKKKNKKKKKK